MTPEEVLRSSAEFHFQWSDRVADQVPADPSQARKGKTDYSEHHADRSASAALEDPLNRQLAELVSAYQSN